MTARRKELEVCAAKGYKALLAEIWKRPSTGLREPSASLVRMKPSSLEAMLILPLVAVPPLNSVRIHSNLWSR